MTDQEPERLALQIRALIQRQNALRAALGERLDAVLFEAEREDIQRVIAWIDQELADLERRLAALPSAPGAAK